MWLLNVYNCITIKNVKNVKTLLFYSNSFIYIVSPWFLKKKNNFIYTNKKIAKINDCFSFETKNIRFRYAGKAYRISKKKKMLFLTLHYPTFKYVIWNNIKLYHKRKKKKLFKFKLNTNSNYKSNFFFNMFKLRVPDTYTKRGILNNIFVYNFRKRKIVSRR